MDNFDKADGYRALVQYLIELIVKTQEKFRGKKL